MKSRLFYFLLCLILGAQPVLAATPAVHDMAGIMLNLAHYPNDAQKAALQGIIANKATTEQERVLATAISNLEHTAADADKPKLKQVMNDVSAPAEVRDLAGIILNMNHKPSTADKSKLQQMMMK